MKIFGASHTSGPTLGGRAQKVPHAPPLVEEWLGQKTKNTSFGKVGQKKKGPKSVWRKRRPQTARMLDSGQFDLGQFDSGQSDQFDLGQFDSRQLAQIVDFVLCCCVSVCVLCCCVLVQDFGCSSRTTPPPHPSPN